MKFFALIGIAAIVFAAYYFYNKSKSGRTSKEPGRARDVSDNKKHL